MWGIIIRPSNFDPDKKYPVLEYIYQDRVINTYPKPLFLITTFMSGIAELGLLLSW